MINLNKEELPDYTFFDAKPSNPPSQIEEPKNQEFKLSDKSLAEKPTRVISRKKLFDLKDGTETVKIEKTDTESKNFLQNTKENLLKIRGYFSFLGPTASTASQKEEKESIEEQATVFESPAIKQKGIMIAPGKAVKVPKGAFAKLKETGLAERKNEEAKNLLKIKEQSTRLLTPETLDELSLSEKNPDLLSFLIDERKELYDEQRMMLSKTIARHPSQKKQWKNANEFIAQLAREKSEITVDHTEKIQKILNRIAVYLDDHTDPRNKKNELEHYVVWLNKELKLCDEGKKNPLESAAHAYHYFLNIHPYQDGNGRMARFMMDLILQRSGLPPANLSGSVDSKNIDQYVFEIENDLNKLVLAIKMGIVDFCKECNQPSPFRR